MNPPNEFLISALRTDRQNTVRGADFVRPCAAATSILSPPKPCLATLSPLFPLSAAILMLGIRALHNYQHRASGMQHRINPP